MGACAVFKEPRVRFFLMFSEVLSNNNRNKAKLLLSSEANEVNVARKYWCQLDRIAWAR